LMALPAGAKTIALVLGNCSNMGSFYSSFCRYCSLVWLKTD
jgi:hypothetical protein